MTPDITPDHGVQAIPVSHYDEAAARDAWEEFKQLCTEEANIRQRRVAAHRRFLAAFTAGAGE